MQAALTHACESIDLKFKALTTALKADLKETKSDIKDLQAQMAPIGDRISALFRDLTETRNLWHSLSRGLERVQLRLDAMQAETQQINIAMFSLMQTVEETIPQEQPQDSSSQGPAM